MSENMSEPVKTQAPIQAPVRRGSIAIGTKAIAEALGIRETTIKRLMKQKKIPFTTAGRDKIFSVGAVEQAFEIISNPHVTEEVVYDCPNLNHAYAHESRKQGVKKKDGLKQLEIPEVMEAVESDEKISGFIVPAKEIPGWTVREKAVEITELHNPNDFGLSPEKESAIKKMEAAAKPATPLVYYGSNGEKERIEEVTDGKIVPVVDGLQDAIISTGKIAFKDMEDNNVGSNGPTFDPSESQEEELPAEFGEAAGFRKETYVDDGLPF